MLLKIKIKSLITYLIYVALILTIAYLLNRFFQMLIFILFYDFIQNCFNYRFHADTLIKEPVKAVFFCKVITIVVEIIYLIFCKDLNISIYLNLLLIFSITFLSCLLEFSLEHIILKTSCLKDKDILSDLCIKAKLSQQATNRLYLKYIDNKTYQEIATIECVDIDTIKKSINRSRNKIFKSLN